MLAFTISIRLQASSLTHRIDLLILPYLELVLEYNPVVKEPTLVLMTSATEQVCSASTDSNLFFTTAHEFP